MQIVSEMTQNGILNVQCITYDTERVKIKAAIIQMKDDKRCFRTQFTYQVQTKTCVTFGFLVIYTQCQSFNPTNTQEHIRAELLNIQYYQTVPIHT